MNYCSQCGARVASQWIAVEQRMRLVCTHCGMVHFENPKVLVACLAHAEGRLVMCRRAHEPGLGLWFPPSGFVEKGESLEDATAREAAEEAGLIVDPETLIPYSLTTLPDLNEIYIAFRVQIPEPTLQAGPESLEVAMFGVAEMPWDYVAFGQADSFGRLLRELQSGQLSLHLSKVESNVRTGRAFRMMPDDTE